MPDAPLIVTAQHGLYCAAGDFYIDPWGRVERAIITHGHTDHARPGSRSYLSSPSGAALLSERLGAEARIETLPFGEKLGINGVTVSLHPAGHLLGSAQVRVEHRGEVWVVSGDYKTEPEASCEPFEPVRCHTFLTESTFALPVYRWRSQAEIVAEMHAWWRLNQQRRRTSVIIGYALGKAQRILAALDPSVGPVFVHEAVAAFLPGYAAAGVKFPPTQPADAAVIKALRGQAIVLAPPGSVNSPWFRQLGPSSTAFASGWMHLRGPRRRQGVDRGFVLSDHADWPGLLDAIKNTGASRVGVMHGYTKVLSRWLNEHGLEAWEVGNHGEAMAERG
jgi:putative mRNA 3-end processing factor